MSDELPNPPSTKTLWVMCLTVLGLGGGGTLYTTRTQLDASEERMVKYTDKAEARSKAHTDRVIAEHASHGTHHGAVSQDTFDEFRRALEAALQGVATKERQDMIIERQKETDAELRKLRDRLNGGGGK